MCVRIAYMNYCTKSLLAITKLSHFSDLDIITHIATANIAWKQYGI